MATLLISNEPVLVVETLDRPVLVQNQGPFLMQVGMTSDLDESAYLNVWESLIPPAGQGVWACCPTCLPGQGSTIFWSEVVGATP